MKFRLSDNEYDVLQKIAKKSNMDCWFGIAYDEIQDCHYITDNEFGDVVELDQGVDELMQGLDCMENYESCQLDLNEELVLAELLQKLNLPLITEYQVCGSYKLT